MRLSLKCGYGFAGVVLAASMVVLGCSQEQASQTPTAEQPSAQQPAAQQPAGAGAFLKAVPTGPVEVSKDDIAKSKEHFMQGLNLGRHGKLDEAIKEYEAAVKLNPNSPQPLSNLGFAYYDKGRIDDAMEAQLAALDRDPELANAYYGLGLVFEAKGDKERAITAWQHYIARSEPHTKYWMSAQEHLAGLEGRKMKKIDLSKGKKKKKESESGAQTKTK